MKVVVYIDQTKALLEGKGNWGYETVEIDPAVLTQEERAMLAEHRHDDLFEASYYSPISVGHADVDVVRQLLQARIVKKKEQEEKTEADRVNRIKDFLNKAPEEFFTASEHKGIEFPSRSVASLNPKTDEEKAAVAAHKEKIKSLEQELMARYAENQAAIKEHDKQERIRKKQEAEQKKKQLEDWVAEYGTESQKARYADNLLAKEEILHGIREQVFAPLAGEERYVKIKSADVCDCNYYCHVDFEVEDAESATAEQYEYLVAVRERMPEATVQLRKHTADCKNHEESLTRYSLLVTVEVGLLTLSREYAVDDDI